MADEELQDEPLTDRAAAIAQALPGLARVTAAAAWHTGVWGAKAYVRTGVRAAKAVVDPDERSALLRDTAEALETVSEATRSALGETIDQPEVDALERTHGMVPAEDSPEALRQRGADLLARSGDVWSEEAGHPAYARILRNMAPDEARMVRLLFKDGPQPIVDVRTGGPSALLGRQLIAIGLSMIGARAGVRYPDRVPAYLNNLQRLGLVIRASEPVRDTMEYQVLEAQPDVLEALHSVKFAKVVRRSLHLSPFGDDFARTCLVDPG